MRKTLDIPDEVLRRLLGDGKHYMDDGQLIYTESKQEYVISSYDPTPVMFWGNTLIEKTNDILDVVYLPAGMYEWLGKRRKELNETG